MARDRRTDNFDAMQKGQVATLAKAEVGALIINREQTIINKAIAAYRGGQLDGIQAIIAFASIAELRSVIGSLQDDINNGVTAADEELNTIPN